MIKYIKSIISYLGTFPRVFSENSTKLLALLLSAIAGFLLAAFVIPFVLIYDVVTNGFIKTNLSQLGMLVLCIGGLIAGAGFNVKVPDFNKHRGENQDAIDEGTDDNSQPK